VPSDAAPYARAILSADATHEVMLAAWAPGLWSAPHDHGGSAGWVLVLEGALRERRHRVDAVDGLVTQDEEVHRAGTWIRIARGAIHSARAEEGPCRTLHVYAPGVAAMRLYDAAARRVLLVDGAHLAALPEDPDLVRHEAAIGGRPPPLPLVLVVHTTHYRDGNAEIARASACLADRLRAEHGDAEVELRAIRKKAEFVAMLTGLADEGRVLKALHFVGHSGMYGIMFGSVAWPEQLSPHEWRALRIPFADGAEAHFHACRTARWFAPFFARTFGVRTYGHRLYTTFSRSPARFVPELPVHGRAGELHVIACPGRKSHGLVGSLRKYAFSAAAEPMIAAEPSLDLRGAAYDAVAPAYARAFDDIRVRRTELRWLTSAIASAAEALGGEPGRKPRVLDVGCGNGALLAHLAPSIADGVGVDVSGAMLGEARRRAARHPHLRFEQLAVPTLPLEDASVDLVVSFLSFRYLDWDPMLREIARVLVPSGRLLVVDLVERPLGLSDAPRLLRSSVDHAVARVTDRRFVRDLRALSAMPEWRQMLAHNPIRAEHEYRWFFESRFPERRLEVLSVSRTKRIVAFDSGPIERALPLSPLSYP
jgi:SAM-dependent methyltransferase